VGKLPKGAIMSFTDAELVLKKISGELGDEFVAG
jgi:hypothetical protein